LKCLFTSLSLIFNKYVVLKDKKNKRIQNNSVNIYTMHVLKKKTENRKSSQVFPEIIMVVYLSTLEFVKRKTDMHVIRKN